MFEIIFEDALELKAHKMNSFGPSTNISSSVLWFVKTFVEYLIFHCTYWLFTVVQKYNLIMSKLEVLVFSLDKIFLHFLYAQSICNLISMIFFLNFNPEKFKIGCYLFFFQVSNNFMFQKLKHRM